MKGAECNYGLFEWIFEKHLRLVENPLKLVDMPTIALFRRRPATVAFRRGKGKRIATTLIHLSRNSVHSCKKGQTWWGLPKFTHLSTTNYKSYLQLGYY